MMCEMGLIFTCTQLYYGLCLLVCEHIKVMKNVTFESFRPELFIVLCNCLPIDYI